MAKRSKKKSPRREQPWVQAVRDRLRAKVEVRVATETSDAFLALAAPMVRALPIHAGAEAIEGVLDLARLAWNLPLLHALSTEAGSDGAQIRAHAARVLPRLRAHSEELAPFFAARTEELRDLGRPILGVLSREADGAWQIFVMTGDEIVDESDMLDIGDNGWPKMSHTLLELSAPVRDRLPQVYSQAEAEEAIALATIAWNLHGVDTRSWSGPPELRRRTLEGAQKARALPAGEREVFEEMAHARATRFSYDPRVIVATSVEIRGTNLHVNAAGVHIEQGGAP